MINAWSRFYYGFEITPDNQYLSFSEGGPELIATIRQGRYAPTLGLEAVAAALNDAGTQIYTVAMDRETRRATISASNPFSLLIASGSTSARSVFASLGFSGADVGPGLTFTGAGQIGSEYRPQFKLQDYIEPEHFKKAIDSTVKKAADGQVEVVTFGLERYLQANIKFATDKAMDGKVIRNNPTGVDDLVDLMDWLITKAGLEIIPDDSNPSEFFTVILEKTQESATGVDFRLRELYDRNLPGFYETGILLFRVIETG